MNCDCIGTAVGNDYNNARRSKERLISENQKKTLQTTSRCCRDIFLYIRKGRVPISETRSSWGRKEGRKEGKKEGRKG